MSLEAIKARCHINEITDCWEWRGAVTFSNGGKTRQPTLKAVDYTLDPTGNTKTLQKGNRAVWHAHTGKPIPKGHKVFRKAVCKNELCMNPAHKSCLTTKRWGKALANNGARKGRLSYIKANRASGLTKSAVAQRIGEVISSTETCSVLAKQMGVSKATISKARRGEMKSALVGNPFAGLL